MKHLSLSTKDQSDDWPKFPLTRPSVRDTKYFRFKNKGFFVDVHNGEILEVYREIIDKCDGAQNSQEAMECAEKIVAITNQQWKNGFEDLVKKKSLKSKPFVSLRIQQNLSGVKPCLFGYELNKNRLKEFVENFSKSNRISLFEKYQYIVDSKFKGGDLSPSTIFSFRERARPLDTESMKRYRDSFYIEKSSHVVLIEETLTGILAFLRKSLDILKKTYNGSITVGFIPDLIAGLDAILILVNSGNLSSCYREIRSLMERLSWVILDDFFSANSFSVWHIEDESLPLMFLNINPLWRDNNDATIRNLDDLFPANFFDFFSSMEKSILRDTIMKNMSIEMYVALAGYPAPDNERSHSPRINRNLILKGIDEITECLTTMSNNQNATDAAIQILRNKWRGHNFAVPMFPTTNFVLIFLKSVFGKNMKILQYVWNRYSLFVHPYVATWEMLPNTSVMEYIVLEHEIHNLEKVIEVLLASITKHFRILKKSFRN